MSYIGNTNTTQAFTPAIDYFSGTGSATAFTLSKPVASVAQVQVVVSNVAQNPSSAYSVSSNTITFTSAPSVGTNNIYVYYTSPITQLIAPSQGTVTSSSFGTIADFTTTGNTTLGDATTDTLTVGVTGIVKDASGNVGIGTTSVSSKLHVVSSSGENKIISEATAASQQASLSLIVQAATPGQTVIYMGKNGATTNGQLGYDPNTNAMTMYTNNTERMRIDSSGTVMVNSTTQVDFSKFQVVGATASNNLIVLQDTGTTYGTSQFYQKFLNSSAAVAGSIQHTAVTTVAYSTTSDGRLKEHKGIATDMSVIDNTVIHDFVWKLDGLVDRGIFAQEAHLIKPTAISVGNDELTEDGNLRNPWGVDYSKYVPELIVYCQQLKKITQEQQALITALTARITALENK